MAEQGTGDGNVALQACRIIFFGVFLDTVQNLATYLYDLA
jgi:hypothetical protein